MPASDWHMTKYSHEQNKSGTGVQTCALAEFKTIHQDMRAFQRDQLLWNRFSEYYFDSFMASVKI